MLWHITQDLKWFKALTVKNIVIMGRKTWESIGSVPLKERINIIVSNTIKQENLQEFKDTFVFTDLK